MAIIGFWMAEISGNEVSPLVNNIIVSLLLISYYKLGYELVWRIFWQSTRTSRQPHSAQLQSAQEIHLICRESLHLLLSSSIAFWPLYDTSCWSWRLNVVLPTTVAARYYYRGAIKKDPDNALVQLLSRSSSPSELLWGPLQWAGILVYLGLYQFQTTEAAVHVAAVGIGDALAPLWGFWYGRHPFQMNPFADKARTMEGSLLGVFLGTCGGIYLCLYATGLQWVPLRLVLVYGALAAVVEGTSPSNFDNLTVSLAINFSSRRIQEWMLATE